MTAPARYSIKTWDYELQKFTPQKGLGKATNLSLGKLHGALKQLRTMGYSADRNDNSVLVEKMEE